MIFWLQHTRTLPCVHVCHILCTCYCVMVMHESTCKLCNIYTHAQGSDWMRRCQKVTLSSKAIKLKSFSKDHRRGWNPSTRAKPALTLCPGPSRWTTFSKRWEEKVIHVGLPIGSYQMYVSLFTDLLNKCLSLAVLKEFNSRHLELQLLCWKLAVEICSDSKG